MINGSDLYNRVIIKFDNSLMHKVWDNTPWMINVFTDDSDSERRNEICHWCNDNFGKEAWPIHGFDGNWHQGGATIDGWTWIGFATKNMMEKFETVWVTK